MKPAVKLTLLFLAAFLLRLSGLATKSFWIDECLAWGAVRLDWMDMVRSVTTGTPHPPLAFMLMKLSTLLAGGGEFGLRFLNALAVASAVIPIYCLSSRRSTPEGGLFAALLWALAPFSVSLGQEAWVYGLTAALSLWFADCVDRAWRGSKKAFIAAFPLGVLGLLTGQVFVLSVAAGSLLYFSVPARERISFLRFLTVPIGLALAFVPVFLHFAGQLAAREARMAAGGVRTDLSRLLSPAPVSVYLRMLFGGMIPELTRNLLERPRMLVAYLVNAAVVFSLGILPLFRWKRWDYSGGKLLWIIVPLPFVLFLRDQPGIRQLAMLWIPFSITSAMFFSAVRRAWIPAILLCAVSLVPYYLLEEFPYHRSNWRGSVQMVESMAGPDDAVVILGGKSTALAWECYSSTAIDSYAPNGETPFAAESELERTDPSILLEDLVSSGRYDNIWLINDIWGQRLQGMHPFGIDIINVNNTGSDMEIGLIRTYQVL